MTFSDECVFGLKGRINKHNVHYWAQNNPYERICNPGATPTLTVWACIGFSGVLCFDVSRQTMNGEYSQYSLERYSRILIDVNNLWYQQDGAPCHYVLQVRQALDENLNGRWIGRRGPIEWLVRLS